MNTSISLLRFKQKGKSLYAFFADPRLIAMYVKTHNPDEPQDAQRPWDKNRVDAIANYVAGNAQWSENEEKKKHWTGFLPNSVLLNATTACIQVNGPSPILTLPDHQKTSIDQLQIFEILDGQHRLFSFLEEHRSKLLPDNTVEPYEMVFIVADNLTPTDKKEMFLAMNRFQEKPKKDTIIWMQKILGVYDSSDSMLVDVIDLLNSNGQSLFLDRIALHGVKKLKKNGLDFTGSSFLRPLKKVLPIITDYANKDLTVSELFSALNSYLQIWNTVWSNALQRGEALSSMNAIQYMIELYPAFLRVAAQKSKKVPETAEQYLKMMQAQLGPDYFTVNRSEIFSSETSLRRFVKEHSHLINSLADYKNPVELT